MEDQVEDAAGLEEDVVATPGVVVDAAVKLPGKHTPNSI